MTATQLNVRIKLAQGPLGYEVHQIARQQDFADYAFIDRGLKLAVIEIKKFRMFGACMDNPALTDALIQAARYADRHRTLKLMAFDGETLCMAHRDRANETIEIDIFIPSIATMKPPDEIYYFTHCSETSHFAARCPTST